MKDLGIKIKHIVIAGNFNIDFLLLNFYKSLAQYIIIIIIILQHLNLLTLHRILLLLSLRYFTLQLPNVLEDYTKIN